MTAQTYKAFVSYSHAADGRLAPAVQAAVQKFGKPWYRLRAVRLFRDKTSLSATPELWPSIVAALGDSEWFLLMATPESAASAWVGREIEWWLKNRSSSRMLIVLTDGELHWDARAKRFDAARSTAISPQLAATFSVEPLYVDLRWARSSEELSLRHSRFRDSMLDIAAPLHGRAKDELDGQDVREHKKTRRLATTAVTALVLFAGAATIAAFLAVRSSRIAEERLKLAQSRQLAAQSIALVDDRHDLALLLAVEASRISETYEAKSALLAGLLHRPGARRYLRTANTAVSSGSYQHEYNRAMAVTFSRDGKRLAVRTWGGGYEIYDASSGAPVVEPLLESEGRNHLAINPGLNLLAVHTADGIVLWDVFQQRELGTFDIGADFDGIATFSPDGTLLATGTADGIIELWNVASFARRGEALTSSNRDGGEGMLTVVYPVLNLEFSRDGGTLSVRTSRERGYRLYDVESNRDITDEMDAQRLRGGQLSADGRRLVRIESTGRLVSVRLDNSAETELLARGDARRGSVGKLAVHPDGKSFATTTSKGNILWWRFGSSYPDEESIFTGRTDINDLAISPDGTLLATASDDGTVMLWNNEAESSLRHELREIRRGTGGLAFSHDGALLAAAGDADGADDWPEILLWNVKEQAPVGELLAHDRCYPSALAFSPDDQTLAAGCRGETLLIWNLAGNPSGEPRRANLRRGRALVSVAYDPSGQRLATGSADRGVFLWDAVGQSPAEVLARSESDLGDVNSLAFSHDGERLYVGGLFVETVWDIQQRAPLPDTLQGHGGHSRTIALSPDGRTLAGSSADGILLWSIPEHALAGQILNLESKDPDADVTTAMAFNADASILAWASEQGDIVLWDTAARQMLGSPLKLGAAGRHEMNQGLAMSPDGRWLAASDPYTVSLWDLDPNSWRQKACQIANRNLDESEWAYYLGDEAFRETCPQPD